MALSDWNERQLLALTGGIVGATLVVMAGLVLYIYTKYSKLEDEIGQVRRENKALKQKADKLERKKSELDRLGKLKKTDELRLPGDEDIGGLVNQVSEQSRGAQLEITRLDRMKERAAGRRPPAAGSSGGKCVPVKMEMVLAGRFHDFGKFLKRLEERLDRIVAVTGFEITANADGLAPDEPAVGIEVLFEAYRYKVPKPEHK